MSHTNREPLPNSPLAALKTALPDWQLDGTHIERWFEFPNFELAINFVHQVAAIARQMDHHPDIDIRYLKVRISLTTHSAGGLTMLDIEAARRIRALLSGPL